MITTNHVALYAGSELVALEIAETFAKRGFEPTIYANYISSPMADEVRNSGIRLMTGERCPDPLAFDVVWSQHHVLPLLLAGRLVNGARKPYFVYTHLSPHEPFEFPGLFSERRLADRYFVNSEETRQKMLSFGLAENMLTNFHNAAPEEFFAVPKKPKARLREILVVSNHLPPELDEAIDRGLDGVIFTRIGNYGTSMRVTPELIGRADAVITIGKTTQYAVAARRPVFCYDVYGGPGWMTMKTYGRAADFNYSGRCTSRKLSAEKISRELQAGFAAAYDDVDRIRALKRTEYTLERYVDDIIEAARPENRPVIDFVDPEFEGLLRAESAMSALIGREHTNGQRYQRAFETVLRERSHARYGLGNGRQIADLSREELLERYVAQRVLYDETEKRLNSVFRSNSWKVTAPLRKAMSLLRQLRAQDRHVSLISTSQPDPESGNC